MSDIEWTDKTWNPIVGCTLASAGCANCYAMRMAHRLASMPHSPQYIGTTELGPRGPRWTGKFSFVESAINRPLEWKKPSRIFPNSMGDLFHPEIPFEWLARVWDIMLKADHHIFQVLTKRPEVAASYAGRLVWANHIHVGTSIEGHKVDDRADELRRVPAPVKFISAEPLIQPLPKIDLTDIAWIIIGGESGHGARPSPIEWLLSVYHQARAQHTKVFLKQLGSVTANKLGLNDKKGGDPEEWPLELRLLMPTLREFPVVDDAWSNIKWKRGQATQQELF